MSCRSEMSAFFNSVKPAMNTLPLHSLLADDAVSEQVVTHEAISCRARELWEEQGCPENCDEAIWLEAEAELLAIQEGRYRHPHLERGFADEL